MSKELKRRWGRWASSSIRQSGPGGLIGLLCGLLVGAVATVVAAAPAGRESAGRIEFNHHIRPLLSDRCFACHGPDEKGRKGKLRLDTEEGAFKSLGEDRYVIKPGDPARSELMRRLTAA